MTFHAMGMRDLDGAWDMSRVNLEPFGGTVPDNVRRGRGGFTGRPEDMYAFKTPQLYNLVDSPFLGHGSSFASVREVIEYKNAAVPENPLVPAGRTAAEFTPLGLTPAEITDLTAFVEGIPGLVYEAHSTDYQTDGGLRDLVRDHFAILKVGPGLTFAWREAVFALAAIEEEWLGSRTGVTPSHLREVVDRVMLEDPAHWRSYHRGEEAELRLARQLSLSDRIRYYWPRPEVQAALARLRANLETHPPPLPLLSQHVPGAYAAVRDGRIARNPGEIARFRVRETAESYVRACGGPPAERLGSNGVEP